MDTMSDKELRASDAEYKPGDVVIHNFLESTSYGHVHVVTEEEVALYEAVHGPCEEEEEDDDYE